MKVLDKTEIIEVNGGSFAEFVGGYVVSKIVDHYIGDDIEKAIDGMFGPAEDLSGMMIAA